MFTCENPVSFYISNQRTGVSIVESTFVRKDSLIISGIITWKLAEA
jgi:hypothetical protein